MRKSVDELLAVLCKGRAALTPQLQAEIVARRVDCIAPLIALAQSETLLAAGEPEGWAPIHAVRMLGRLEAREAIPTLVHLVEQAQTEEQVGAEAGLALQRIGPAVIQPLSELLERTDNAEARHIALEVMANLAMEYRGGNALARARKTLENLLLTSDDAGQRSVYAEYLGDLADASSVPVLMQAVTRSDLSHREYEAIRDTLERLDGRCPDYYFDASGKGYPLDEEKHPLCPACRGPMIIQETGDLSHPERPCASLTESPDKT